MNQRLYLNDVRMSKNAVVEKQQMQLFQQVAQTER